MGTRNLTIVVKDKKYRVAQYAQWDGYPTGQGVTIAEFIQNKMDLRKFKKAIDNTKFITSEEITARWRIAGADDSDYVDSKVSNKFEELYPELSRNTGADVLEIIQDNSGGNLQNSVDFVGDSLFCEWAYVIDLDKKMVEVYKGFNEKPLTKRDRFYKIKTTEGGNSNHNYKQVKLLKKYTFKAFTEANMLKLEASLKDED